MPSFADLTIPFPLFEADIDEASEYVGAGHCIACQRQQPHCFDLGIGSDVIVECDSCKSVNALDADDATDGRCRTCGSEVAFPPYENESVQICYSCLRAGLAAITKDTRLGMVTWEQALEGVTHGLPGLSSADFVLVRREGSDWVGARVPSPLLFELVRTPTYSTLQGEQWEFCCRAPMVYVGRWSQREFNAAAEGDGRSLFDQIVQDPVDGLWEDELHDTTGIYVFRCSRCGRRTANWDIA